jgi:hypothetical protein
MRAGDKACTLHDMTALLTITSLPNALAEAWESGIPVAPPPPGLLPTDLPAAEDMAAELVGLLSLPVCGVRVTEAGLLGPLPPARLVSSGAALPLGALPHGMAAPALIGVLAEPLDPEGEGPPVFSALHPGLDLSASRFQEGPPGDAALVADLLGLGHVVAGAAGPVALPTACGLDGAPAPVALEPLLEKAALATRRAGGLPVGAVVVLVLAERAVPVDSGTPTAEWPGLGRAQATIG